MKTTSIFTAVAAAFVFFAACKKEVQLKKEATNSGFDYQVESKLPYSQIKTVKIDFGTTNGNKMMLSFPSMSTFKFAMNELKRQTMEYDKAFMKKYNNRSIEELNKKMEELQYNSEKPLLDFSAHYKFYNLYSQIEEREKTFLQQEELAIENDPDNHFIVEDEVRALLNTECEVMINDTIYKLTEKGYYAVCDGNLASLQELRNNGINYTSLPNVTFSGTDNSRDICDTDKRNSDYKPVGNYRIKWVVSHWTHPWGRRVTAKLDNYYYQGKLFKKWVKKGAASYCQVYGYVSGTDGNCNTQFDFNPTQAGASSGTPVESWEHTIAVETKTKSEWMHAYFAGINGITHYQILRW